MRSESELIHELEALGVTLTADGPDLVLRPKSSVPEGLLPEVRRLKGNILARLARAPGTVAVLQGKTEGKHTPHLLADEASRGALRDSMRRDFQTLLRRTAQVYEQLSAQGREMFLSSWSPLEARMDQAYQEGNWVGFQAALVEAGALLTEAQPDDSQAPVQKHWVYQAWSRVLDAEVWFVCCEQEVAQLAKTGLARGSIYTEAELVELLRLPQPPSAETLRSLHAVKSYFDATVVQR